MGCTRQMGRAENTVALPLEGVMAIVEVYTFSTLLHVKTPFGRSAQKTVTLPPPCFVWAGPTGCADDTVLLGPPNNVGALISAALDADPLPSPMPADTRRPRTAFQTSPLLPPPSILLLSMRTPQMLMTLRTLVRLRPVSARFRRHIRPNQTNWLLLVADVRTCLSGPNFPTFWLFPQTSYGPQTTAHECTDLLYRSDHLLLFSPKFPPFSTNTSFLPTSTSIYLHNRPPKKRQVECVAKSILGTPLPFLESLE